MEGVLGLGKLINCFLIIIIVLTSKTINFYWIFRATHFSNLYLTKTEEPLFSLEHIPPIPNTDCEKENQLVD